MKECILLALRRTIVVILLSASIIELGLAQATNNFGHPFVTQFSVKDYRQGSQNYAITQDWLGRMFVGNANGVMIYQGSHWQTYKVNNLTEVHSLYADSVAKRVFVGAQGEIGYIAIDSLTQQFAYHTLLTNLSDQVPDFHDVHRIDKVNEVIIFHVNTGLIILKGQEFTFLKLHTKDSRVFCINNKLYVYENGIGIKELNPKNEDFSAIKWPYNSLQLSGLVGIENLKYWLTREKGFFVQVGDSFKRLTTDIDSLILGRNSFLFTLNNKLLAVATLGQGLYILDTNGSLVYHLSEEEGLVSNTVWEVHQDKENQEIWLAQNNGISRVELSSVFTNFSSSGINEQQFFSIKKFNNAIYAAGGTGVVRLGLLNRTTVAKFKKIPQLYDRAWFIAPTANPTSGRKDLLISSNQGLFALDESDNLTNIISDLRCWFILPLKSYPGYALINTATGFKIIKNTNSGWELYREIEIIKNSFYYFVEDKSGNIWANSPTTGIYKFNFSGGINGELQSAVYNGNAGLPSHLGNIPFLLGDSLVVGTVKGCYYYRQETNKFLPHQQLNNEVLGTNKGRVTWLEEDDYGRLFFVYGEEHFDGYFNKSGYAIKNEVGNFIPETSKFTQIENLGIYDFLSLNNDQVFIATTSGILQIKPNKELTVGPKIYVGTVNLTNHDSVIWINGGLPEAGLELFSLPYDQNSFIFHVGTFVPSKSNSIKYQYKLVGLDETWQPWTVSPVREFTNLLEGNYTLEIRAKDHRHIVGPVLSVPFSIKKPWFRTTTAFVLYALGIVLIIWLISFVYNLRLKNRTTWLESIVNERTTEISRRNQEIEEKNILLQSKSQKIELQSQALKHKNKDLVDARNTIDSQLQELKYVNEQLEDKVNKRTAELQLAYKELLVLKNELDTFIYKSSHDINGPLMRLRGLCQVAQIEVKNEESRKYLELLCNETDRAILILRKLLVFYEVKNSQPVLNWVAMHMVVEHVERELGRRNLLEYADISWTVHPLVNYLLTDTKLLQILLIQLLENAIQYRQYAKAEINIVAEAVGQEMVSFSVCDNGIGIPQEARDKIFEMFYRASVKSIGPGMGLYTAKSAVLKLGGSIVLEELEPYTKLTVNIPTRYTESQPVFELGHSKK